MRLLLLLLLLPTLVAVVHGGDLLHYYKLKKFVTAVAFARALGRRPTILPVPIPIPIPMSQNEVIRIPANKAKTLLTLTGSPKYSGKRGGSKYMGSSSFGYALPGSFDSSSLMGGGGGSNIMVLDGGNGVFDGYDGNNFFDAINGESEFASPSVIRMLSGKQYPRIFGSRPRQVILRGVGGGRTTRDSEFGRPPPVRHYGESRKKTTPRKPIPVGEKFRLP